MQLIICFFLSAEECDAFKDRSTQSVATPEILCVDAPGSSHVSIQNAELQILSVHGQGERHLMVEGHDTLFTASELEALNSLSADYSGAKSLDCGERLDCRKELAARLKFPLPIYHPKVRLTLLQLQHTPLESTHLYDSICR